MRKHIPWRMTVVTLSCLLLLAVGGPARSQRPGDAGPDKKLGPGLPEPDRLDLVKAPPPAKPAARSVDDLLAQLAKVREQQAELATQEKALVEELRAKHQAQTEGLTKLGVLHSPAPIEKDVDVPAIRIPKGGPGLPK